MRLVLFCVMASCAGCTSYPNLYAEAGVGYTFHQSTEGDFLSDCNVPFFVEGGYEEGSHTIAVRHDSSLDCGYPVGTKYDYSTNSILYSFKVGKR